MNMEQTVASDNKPSVVALLKIQISKHHLLSQREKHNGLDDRLGVINRVHTEQPLAYWICHGTFGREQKSAVI